MVCICKIHIYVALYSISYTKIVNTKSIKCVSKIRVSQKTFL